MPPTPVDVTVIVQDARLPLDCPEEAIPTATWKLWLQTWFSSQPELPNAEAYELSLCLTDDAEIQRLNAHYRGKNAPTDVLAFAALEVNVPQRLLPEAEPLYVGDIIISVETAWQQAQQQGHSLRLELAWLTAHGLLHLLGWDHPDDPSLMAMLSEQETLLQQVSLI